MSVPPETPLLFLAAAAIGTIITFWVTSSPEKKKEGGPYEGKWIIHNLLKRRIRSPLIGAIEPGGFAYVGRKALIPNSAWTIEGVPFLTIDDHPYDGKHIYIGGVVGAYVYTDQQEITAPSAGPKEIFIINLTKQELRLLGIPPIPPSTRFLYRGPSGSGLDLGSEFVDTMGNFPNYVMNTPITRLVYGVVDNTPPFDKIRLTDGMENLVLSKPGGVLL